MQTISRLSSLALAAALAASAGLGCRGSDPKPTAGDPPPAQATAGSAEAPAGPTGGAAPAAEYTADIEKLCDVVRLSGVGAVAAEDRRVPIANWLAANLTTTESRRFLAQIQPLTGDAKADALEAEARRVGLPGCALAAEWRTPPAAAAPPAP